jgi:hypothetical protein
VQVEASHEILEDIFKWFLINIKNASEQHKEPTKADGEAAESKRALVKPQNLILAIDSNLMSQT